MICNVFGTILDVTGSPIQGVSVSAALENPIVQADGSLVPPFVVATTTDGSGNWGLNLTETTTQSRTITVNIDMPTASFNTIRQSYAIQVPNQPSVAFTTLITGQ